MGSWQLEVFRMSVYMLFPVGLFYYFNHPEFYQEHVCLVAESILLVRYLKAIHFQIKDKMKKQQEAVRKGEDITKFVEEYRKSKAQ